MKKPMFNGEDVIPLKAVMGLECHMRRPSYSTVCDWVKWGVGGVKLESHRQGRRIFTSVQAVERFNSRLNGAG